MGPDLDKERYACAREGGVVDVEVEGDFVCMRSSKLVVVVEGDDGLIWLLECFFASPNYSHMGGMQELSGLDLLNFYAVALRVWVLGLLLQTFLKIEL